MTVDEYGLSWVGASWQRSLELAEEEYKMWLQQSKEKDTSGTLDRDAERR